MALIDEIVSRFPKLNFDFEDLIAKLEEVAESVASTKCDVLESQEVTERV